MIKIDHTEVLGWKAAIRGMRNPMNSWDKSDTVFIHYEFSETKEEFDLAMMCGGVAPFIKENDLDLMKRLCKAGTDHRKFMRMIVVYCDITAPLYWWKEFDTYKVGTVSNSCSTMHKIHDKEFNYDDFSYDHLFDIDDPGGKCHYLVPVPNSENRNYREEPGECVLASMEHLTLTIDVLNTYRARFLRSKNKDYWWQMIQLLPTSYNQKRTVMLNYEVLANIYKSRKNHKLDEWRDLCIWIEGLPYSEIITGEE